MQSKFTDKSKNVNNIQIACILTFEALRKQHFEVLSLQLFLQKSKRSGQINLQVTKDQDRLAQKSLCSI